MDDLVSALVTELELRKNYIPTHRVESIYFGGGTPSLLTPVHLEKIFNSIFKNYDIAPGAEITLEANPDDLTSSKLHELRQFPINRLSIGIQSFNDTDLRFMNRSHNAEMAEKSVRESAEAGFENITIDLIYGLPGMSDSDWKANLQKAFALPIHHISCYNLTLEKKTALYKMVREGKVKMVEDDIAANQFLMLMDEAEAKGFVHYEISNFGKQGFFSRHNVGYWNGTLYSGVGPSAHSYNGQSRQWNVAGNAIFISQLREGNLPFESEDLTLNNRFNEYILTRLRTMWGVDANFMESNFGSDRMVHFRKQIAPYLISGDVEATESGFILSRKGKFIADRIASDLFV